MDIAKIVISAAEAVPKLVHWVREADSKRRFAALCVVLLPLLLAGGLLLPAEMRQAAYRQAWPWVAAALSTDHLVLDENQSRQLRRHKATLSANLETELADHFDAAKLSGDKGSRYTVWTLAETSTALLGTDKSAKVLERAKDIEAFMRAPQRQIAGCGCWSEFPGQEPQHIGVTAWVLYGLARLEKPPRDGELQFLAELQDGAGGWNMFNVPFGLSQDPGLQRPQGSSFATSWALLALSEMLSQRLITDRNAREQVARQALHAVDFFLHDSSNRDPKLKLWSLYPGWRGMSEASIGTSGLVLFALHHHIDSLDRQTADTYTTALHGVDRDFIDALPDSASQMPDAAAANSFGYALAYQPVTSHGGGVSKPAGKAGEMKIDSVASLTLPWMLVGAQAAYPSASYTQRVHALRFVGLAMAQLDDGGLDRALHQHYWMAPEMLLALRYLDDPRALND